MTTSQKANYDLNSNLWLLPFPQAYVITIWTLGKQLTFTNCIPKSDGHNLWWFFLLSFQLCDSSYKHGDSIIKRSGPIRWWFNFSPQLTVEISVPMVIISQGLQYLYMRKPLWFSSGSIYCIGFYFVSSSCNCVIVQARNRFLGVPFLFHLNASKLTFHLQQVLLS